MDYYKNLTSATEGGIMVLSANTIMVLNNKKIIMEQESSEKLNPQEMLREEIGLLKRQAEELAGRIALAEQQLLELSARENQKSESSTQPELTELALTKPPEKESKASEQNEMRQQNSQLFDQLEASVGNNKAFLDLVNLHGMSIGKLLRNGNTAMRDLLLSQDIHDVSSWVKEHDAYFQIGESGESIESLQQPPASRVEENTDKSAGTIIEKSAETEKKTEIDTESYRDILDNLEKAQKQGDEAFVSELEATAQPIQVALQHGTEGLKTALNKMGIEAYYPPLHSRLKDPAKTIILSNKKTSEESLDYCVAKVIDVGIIFKGRNIVPSNVIVYFYSHQKI